MTAQGAKVVITGKNKNALLEAESALGANATGFVANQASISDLGELVKKQKRNFGVLTYLSFMQAFFFYCQLKR